MANVQYHFNSLALYSHLCQEKTALGRFKKNAENDIHSRWIAGSSPLVPPDPRQNAAGAPSPQDPVGESLLSPPSWGLQHTPNRKH